MKQKFGENQLNCLTFALLLVPALRLYPSASATLSGRAGWLGALLSLPAALLFALLTRNVTEMLNGKETAQELIICALGRRSGRAVLILYTAWFTVYAAFLLCSGAQRLVTTIYSHSSGAFFCLSMGAVGIWAAMLGTRTLCRFAKIVLPTVVGILVLVLIFALFSVEKDKLFPVTVYDLPAAAKSVLPAMDVVSVCLVVRCFLSGGLDRITVKRRGIVLWTVFSAAFLTLLDIAVIGSLGAGLTSVLTLPFFTLVRNLVFFNAVERVEAFLVALWVFPDMLFVSALLRCMGDNVSAVVSDRKKSHYIFAGLAGLTLLLSLLMGYDQQLLAQMSEKYIPAANIVLSVGLFSAVCAIICGKAEE